MTWTATMVTCSHWVGLTLPGMMEEPGSLAGMLISPRPTRGPDASHRTSLAIFIMSQASALTAPWATTISSLEVSAWNLFSAVTNALPVRAETFSATLTSKPSGAFSPVPTAVPPRASAFRGSTVSFSSSTSFSREERQPEISWEKLIGTASCRWVRPDLTMPSFSFSSRLNSSMSSSAAGMSLSSTARTAAMCIAVGKVSFEDWDMLMSSFGWQSFSTPAMALARFAMTSLVFMLDWVPEPVCQTTSGKLSFSSPAMTSSQAFVMAASFSSVIFAGFSSWFASAAAFFRMPKAWVISRGMVSMPTPISKFS